MSVTYLLPSNRPTLLALQVAALSKALRPEDDVATSSLPGMCNAIRAAFKQAKTDIVRNCADDDDYSMPDSMKAVEFMERSDIDVLVTGGYKSARAWKNAAVCVPDGENYGASPESVAWYGACGSGLFMRTKAVEKYDLLAYDGPKLIDNFIVLKAIDAGAKVRFARFDTYRHHMSLSDMTPADYCAFQEEKRVLRSRFGVWGVKRRAHLDPPVWDGGIA